MLKDSEIDYQSLAFQYPNNINKKTKIHVSEGILSELSQSEDSKILLSAIPEAKEELVHLKLNNR